MGKRSERAQFDQECKESKNEATVADMDRLAETQQKLGIFFRDFNQFEAWEAQQEQLAKKAALSADAPSSTTSSAVLADWDAPNSESESELPPAGGAPAPAESVVNVEVRVQRHYTARVIGANGRHMKRLRDKYRVSLTSNDTVGETIFHITGIEANVREAKAEIETIVRNADLEQYRGISIRQKSRSFDLENVLLAAPTDTSTLPQKQAVAFSNPALPIHNFDAALLNAPGFKSKLVSPLLSRVAKKIPLPAGLATKAGQLLEFDSSTSILDALTGLDHVESQILHATGNAEVQQYVTRQRAIAFQLFVRLMDDLRNYAGPKRIRYLTGVNREWNHIDIARLFEGSVTDVIRCRVGGADLSIDGRAYVVFETQQEAARPFALGRVKTCDVPRKREAFTTQMVFRMRSLYAICTGMQLSDQGYRHSSMQPIREARRTAAMAVLPQAQASGSGVSAALGHVERSPPACTECQTAAREDAEEELVSDDEVETGDFPAQQTLRRDDALPPSPQFKHLLPNRFIKFALNGAMQRPKTPLKWAAGNTPVEFWMSRLLVQHYAPMLWLKMTMMGKTWRRRDANNEMNDRVVTKSGYISRERMLQRLRELWDQFAPNCTEFQEWFYAKLAFEDYMYVDKERRRRVRLVNQFNNTLSNHQDHTTIDRSSLFAPPARDCYAIPKESYLVLVDSEEEMQKFVRYAEKWTSTTIVAYDSEGSSSYPQTLQFATGPWNKAHSIVVDVPGCRNLPSFCRMVNVLRHTDAKFFAQATLHESETLSSVAADLRFKHLIDVRIVVYDCWLNRSFVTNHLDPVEALKVKEVQTHPNLTAFHYLVNGEKLSKAETIGTHWVRPLSNASLRYCHADVLCMLKTIDKCRTKNGTAFLRIMNRGGLQNYSAVSEDADAYDSDEYDTHP